jgi:hypothetical protein
LRVLQALRTQLRPGGSLVLTVPAHMVLWSDYDTAAGHRRRYSRRELVTRLASAGFCVRYCTEFMLPLFPLMLVRRRLFWGRTRVQKDPSAVAALMDRELQIDPIVNGLLALAVRPEPWFIVRGLRLWGGTSLLAVATRADR